MHLGPVYPRSEPTGRTKTRIGWMMLAATAALVPGVVLPLQSYAVYGYLTLDVTLLLAILLPCAILAFLASVHEARPLWSNGSHQDAVVAIGMTAFGLLLAGAAAISVWSGGASCYECDFGWFFMIALPSLILEFAAGIIWLFLLRDALRMRSVSAPS